MIEKIDYKINKSKRKRKIISAKPSALVVGDSSMGSACSCACSYEGHTLKFGSRGISNLHIGHKCIF